MNIFFELSDSITAAPGKYLVAYDVVGDLLPRYIGAVRASERIWCEDEMGVKFIKNRTWPPDTTPVDMKEFFWVKLKSVTL